MKTPPEPLDRPQDDDDRPTEEMPQPGRQPVAKGPSPSAGRPAVNRGTSRTFQSGQVVADRYRIIRFLAAGGRGEVYEALDVDLDERVALKCVRRQVSEDPKAKLRFKREIHLARRITHPNICRLFDVAYHRFTGGESELLFLTMELLPGETLVQTIEREGPFSTGAALPIVEQMCDGLQAAHEAGVVHRDFKSDNVILVPSGPGGALRAVITDFGLARADSETSFASLTATGKVVGTPAYMAPEQIQGERVDRRADIYALGVVLFEMLTGKLPFVGDSPLSTAIKRLEQAPPSPRIHVADIDPLWERVILRCLARDPGRRYATAGEVKRDLLEGSTRSHGLRDSPRWLRVAAGAVVLAGLLAAGYHAVRSARGTTDRTLGAHLMSGESSPAVRRPTVGVLEFHSLTGSTSPDWHGEALADLLSDGVGQLRSVRGMDYDEMWWHSREEGLTASKVLDAQSIRQARPLLASDYLVMGSYLVLDGPSPRTLRLDLRVVRVKDGDTLGAIGEVGSENALPELVDRAIAALVGRLNLGDGAQQWRLQEQWPSSPVAGMRALFSARRALRESDLIRAENLLESAGRAMPKQPLVSFDLGRVLALRGQTEAARDAFREAWNSTGSGPAEERLLREAAFRRLNGEWSRVVEIDQALWGFFPDDLTYGLDLVVAQIQDGRLDSARQTLSDLRRSFQRPLETARISLVEASSSELQPSDDARATLARESIKRAEGVGATRLAARGRLVLSLTLEAAGRPEEAVEALSPALAEVSRLGDPGLQSELSCRVAELQLARGQREAAEEAAQNAQTIASSRGLDVVQKRAEAVLQELREPAALPTDAGAEATPGSI